MISNDVGEECHIIMLTRPEQSTVPVAGFVSPLSQSFC